MDSEKRHKNNSNIVTIEILFRRKFSLRVVELTKSHYCSI